MKHIDRLGEPEVMDFIGQLLADYDTSLVDWVKLLPLYEIHYFHGRCDYPIRTRPRARTFKRGYRIRASVHIDPPVPLAECFNVGTQTADNGRVWNYVSERVTFRSRSEIAVWLLAHEVFHFLRHSQQIPGRQSETQADKFGIEQLKRWRTRC